jgi:hypothetical protein
MQFKSGLSILPLTLREWIGQDIFEICVTFELF